VGSAQRTVRNWLFVTRILDELGVHPNAIGIDVGRASGLPGRLLCDSGYIICLEELTVASTLGIYQFRITLQS
jgi:hypothetical protein